MQRDFGYFTAKCDVRVNKDLALKHYLIFSPVKAGIVLVAANFFWHFSNMNYNVMYL